MTNCCSCHEELEPGWKKCPACRTPVYDATKCTQCGAGRKPHWKVCPECDADLPGEGTTIPALPGPAGLRCYREVEPGTPWYPYIVSSEQRAEAHRLGIPLVIQQTKSGVVLVLVPGGTYWMGASPGDAEALGDENPRHEVTLRPFYVGVAPVLQEQWEKVTGQNPSNFKTPKRPVECVSWSGCQTFLERANEGLPVPRLRLPTEAEWEYFARAGTKSRYWWGDEYRKGMANCNETDIDGAYLKETTVVGHYPANPWGLLDVAGNVQEWCQDNYEGGYRQAPRDGRAIETGGWTRVLRGGSWGNGLRCIRVSSRSSFAGHEVDDVGCRLVRDAIFP